MASAGDLVAEVLDWNVGLIPGIPCALSGVRVRKRPRHRPVMGPSAMVRPKGFEPPTF